MVFVSNNNWKGMNQEMEYGEPWRTREPKYDLKEDEI